MLTPTEQLFEDVFIRSLKGWNAITGFRRAALAGLPLAKPTLLEDYREVAKSLTVPAHPGQAPIILGGSLITELAAHETAESILRSAGSAVHAATVTFGHSVLDAAAHGFCKVTRLADPEAWTSVIDKRQVDLAAVRTQSYELVRDQLLDRYFDQLERESLLTKVDLLHARCQPASGWSPMTGYLFDRSVLSRLDTLRHDITHGGALLQGVPSLSDDDVYYLARTGWYFMGLVNKRYGLRLRQDFLVRMARPSGGGP
jgi:hypothetical protein